MNFLPKTLLFVTFLCLLSVIFAGNVRNSKSKSDFLIENLPGLDTMPSFKMYSGHIKISNDKSLFFFLAEAESNPQEAPLVLWQSGGK